MPLPTPYGGFDCYGAVIVDRRATALGHETEMKHEKLRELVRGCGGNHQPGDTDCASVRGADRSNQVVLPDPEGPTGRDAQQGEHGRFLHHQPHHIRA